MIFVSHIVFFLIPITQPLPKLFKNTFKVLPMGHTKRNMARFVPQGIGCSSLYESEWHACRFDIISYFCLLFIHESITNLLTIHQSELKRWSQTLVLNLLGRGHRHGHKFYYIAYTLPVKENLHKIQKAHWMSRSINRF